MSNDERITGMSKNFEAPYGLNDLTTLGDTHLGKVFRTGVPLHRKGDREEMVWAQFEASLMNVTTKYHVMMGDLFDAFAVPEAVVLRAADIYRRAAAKNPGTYYIILRGNHDASRDVTKASSFDVFSELMCSLDNNVFPMKDVGIVGPYGFIPWHPFKSSTELAHDLLAYSELGTFPAVFGHWDTVSYGGNDDNLVPTNVLNKITKLIYTGHIHLPSVFERDGVTVNVVGSMQPYSHSEDGKDLLYVTVPAGQEVGKDFTNKNLRLLVNPDEPYSPGDIDCLSLITKRVSSVEEEGEEPDIEVSYEAFDMRTLFTSCLSEANVGSAVADQIMQKYEELKNA